MPDAPCTDCGDAIIAEIAPLLTKSKQGDVYGALIKLLGGMMHSAPRDTRDEFTESTFDLLRMVARDEVPK